MGLELAKAYIRIEMDSTKFRAGLQGLKSSVTGAVAGIGSKLTSIQGMLGLGAGVGGLVLAANDAAEAASEAQLSFARLAGVVKATGGATGYTANQLSKYAEQLQRTTTFGDEAIMDAMSQLVTFKQVTGDTFKRATEAALDLSATGFGSIDSASLMLGKALENPIEGLNALTRVGVTLTTEQKKMVKEFMKVNELGKAQALILEAVEGQVKGTAAALAATDAGKLKQMNEELGNIKERLGNEILPLLIKMKQGQIDVYNGIVSWSTALGMFADNQKTSSAVFTNSYAIGIQQVKDYFSRMWQDFIIGVKTFGQITVAVFAGVVKAMGGLAFAIVPTFVNAGKAMKDAMWAVFSDDTIDAAFDRAMQRQRDTIKDIWTQFKKDVDISDAVKQAGQDMAKIRGKESPMMKLLKDEQQRLIDEMVKNRQGIEERQRQQEMPGGLTAPSAAAASEDRRGMIGAGFRDFIQHGRTIQESLLKSKDSHQAVMVDLLQRGVKIQEELLKETKDKKPQTALGLT